MPARELEMYLLLISSRCKNASEVTCNSAAALWLCLQVFKTSRIDPALYLSQYSYTSQRLPRASSRVPAHLINAMDFFSFWTLVSFLFFYREELHESPHVKSHLLSAFISFLCLPLGSHALGRQWEIYSIHHIHISCDFTQLHSFHFISSHLFPRAEFQPTYLLFQQKPSPPSIIFFTCLQTTFWSNFSFWRKQEQHEVCEAQTNHRYALYIYIYSINAKQ